MKCRSRTLWWESCALLPSLSMWHILLRSSPHCNQGPATESQHQLVAGKQWELRGVPLAGAPGKQTATAAHVPQFQEWVGWVEGERMTLGSPVSFVRQAPVKLILSPSYPLSVVPSSALLFALAGCYRVGPLCWCLCNLLGNFQGHLISSSLSLSQWRFSHLLPRLLL